MKILVSIASGSNNTERNILRSFYDGIEKYFFEYYRVNTQKALKKECDIDLRLSYDPEIEKCDIAVQFGTVKERNNEHHVTRQSIKKNARSIVCIETPLLGRKIVKNSNHSFFRIGVNGFLNNEGIFYADNNLELNRIQFLKENGLEIKDFPGWKDHSSGHILILLQLPGDASLRNQKLSEWFTETVDKIRSITDRTILVRFHPAMSDKGRAEFFSEIGDLIFKNYPNIYWSNGLDSSLENDLAPSGICVSYSSGSCIDAVLHGVPVIAMDEGNLAYPISSRRVEDINNPRLASHGEVNDWLCKLANSQWNEHEMLLGKVWGKLFPLILEQLNK